MSYILEALKRKEDAQKPMDMPDIKTLYRVDSSEVTTHKSSIWAYVPWALMMFLSSALVLVGYQWATLPKRVTPPQIIVAQPTERDEVLAQEREAPKSITQPSIASESSMIIEPGVENAVSKQGIQKTPAEKQEQAIKPRFVPQLPHLADLPTEIQNALGRIEVKGHFYSTEPLHSAILVNEGYFYVGEEIRSGLILTEVTPKGAHFRYGAHDFQIAVIQNWLY